MSKYVRNVLHENVPTLLKYTEKFAPDDTHLYETSKVYPLRQIRLLDAVCDLQRCGLSLVSSAII